MSGSYIKNLVFSSQEEVVQLRKKLRELNARKVANYISMNLQDMSYFGVNDVWCPTIWSLLTRRYTPCHNSILQHVLFFVPLSI